jgi:hypothetical protein
VTRPYPVPDQIIPLFFSLSFSFSSSSYPSALLRIPPLTHLSTHVHTCTNTPHPGHAFPTPSLHISCSSLPRTGVKLLHPRCCTQACITSTCITNDGLSTSLPLSPTHPPTQAAIHSPSLSESSECSTPSPAQETGWGDASQSAIDVDTRPRVRISSQRGSTESSEYTQFSRLEFNCQHRIQYTVPGIQGRKGLASWAGLG